MFYNCNVPEGFLDYVGIGFDPPVVGCYAPLSDHVSTKGKKKRILLDYRENLSAEGRDIWRRGLSVGRKYELKFTNV